MQKVHIPNPNVTIVKLILSFIWMRKAAPIVIKKLKIQTNIFFTISLKFGVVKLIREKVHLTYQLLLTFTISG